MTLPSTPLLACRSRLAVALASTLAATTLALPPLVVRAQSPTPAPQATAPAPAPGSAHRPRHGDSARREALSSLMTPEERSAFREKMQAAGPQEREALARAQRQELERRANERGITLPAPSGARAHGPGGHHGADDPAREARRQAYQSLTTPEERTAFREKLRAAAPEERRTLAQAHRSEIEQRARDRGITLPPPPSGHRHPERSRGPRMAPPAPPAPPAS